MDQVPLNSNNVSEVGSRGSFVVHRPVTPYVLLPQDRLDIESYFPVDLSHDGVVPYIAYYVTAKGYQEVPSDVL